jgi:hypothetical protein
VPAAVCAQERGSSLTRPKPGACVVDYCQAVPPSSADWLEPVVPRSAFALFGRMVKNAYCKRMFHRYVASVSYRCCKSRSGCCICCNICTYMLQASVPNILSVFFNVSSVF